MNNSNRLEVLDAFRGIAAIVVVLYHYTSRYGKIYDFKGSPITQIFQYGYLGVHLFFMISGFVIFMSIQKNKNPLQFLYKRFTRLYPTYWICLLVTFLIVSIFTLPGRQTDLTESLINLTMFQEVFDVPHLDGSYWSLTIELFFYLHIATLLFLKSIKHIYYWSILFLLLFIINKVVPIPVEDYYMNLTYSPLFLSGIFFYKLKFLNSKWFDHLFIVSCLFSFIFFSKSHAEQILITLFFASFYLFIYNKLDFINQPPLIFLGKISYALYLLHQNIGYVIMNLLRSYIDNHIIIYIIPMLITIILAWVVTKYVEKPLSSALRNIPLIKASK